MSNPSGTPADASPLSLHSPCFPQYTIIPQNAKAEKCILLTFASFSDLIVRKETEGKPYLKYGFPSQIVSERDQLAFSSVMPSMRAVKPGAERSVDSWNTPSLTPSVSPSKSPSMSIMIEVGCSPFTVNLEQSNTCREPSFRAASTSATLSAVPSAQLSPSSVMPTALSS